MFRKANHLASYVSILGLFLLLSGCSGGKDEQVADSIDNDLDALASQIEDPFVNGELLIASGYVTARAIVADLPQVQTLIVKGSPAGDFISARFENPQLSNRDYALASYAYVLEQLHHTQALPALEAFVRTHDRSVGRELFWAVEFAKHAITELRS